jgi:hypothetical protein
MPLACLSPPSPTRVDHASGYSQFVSTEETPAPRLRWVQTTAGVIVVNGIVTAVVSSIVTAIINNAGTLPWGSILLTFGVIAVAVFLLLSIIRKRLRETIWARPARWTWSWRPVSARRHARELQATTKGLGDLATKADLAIGQVRTSLEKVTLSLATKQNESQERVDVIMNGVEDLDKQYKALRGALDASRKPSSTIDAAADVRADVMTVELAPAPRWRLVDPRNRTDQNQDDGKFIIQNLVKNSVARNVRLDNDGVGHFEFEDGAFWPDFSGIQTWSFGGEIVDSDSQGDVRLQLSWLDESNRQFSQLYWLNRDGTFRPIYPDSNGS